MDGQTDVGHINLIGGLVTRNPPKNLYLLYLNIICVYHTLYVQYLTIVLHRIFVHTSDNVLGHFLLMLTSLPKVKIRVFRPVQQCTNNSNTQ